MVNPNDGEGPAAPGTRLYTTIREEAEKDHYHITREIEENLPIFTGDSEVSFEEFDRRLKDWLHLIPDNNQQPFIGRILRKLQGRARHVVEDMEIRSVTEFMNVLRSHFKLGNPLRVSLSKLTTARRGNYEAVESCYYRLRSILRKIQAAVPEEDRGATMNQAHQLTLDAFFESLPDYLKCLASIAKYTTLTALFEAIQEQAIKYDNNMRLQNPRPAQRDPRSEPTKPHSGHNRPNGNSGYFQNQQRFQQQAVPTQGHPWAKALESDLYVKPKPIAFAYSVP